MPITGLSPTFTHTAISSLHTHTHHTHCYQLPTLTHTHAHTHCYRLSSHRSESDSVTAELQCSLQVSEDTRLP